MDGVMSLSLKWTSICFLHGFIVIDLAWAACQGAILDRLSRTLHGRTTTRVHICREVAGVPAYVVHEFE